ncbi:hypothetical protein [Clostridium folliculivorans]|uniref:Uncharacterized protein n=1 Tax=Clostridium folliculivorans TaxID=2886038 RepID=A0A9W6D9G7_9CLOT|nr:hypothetical protein [Clostridium folliculivorans]GKU23881.1 hypothetical protein CFOLD11_07070 [Clostridium folliculivorans]GKU29997.1 hypothetical protein CFB3_21040 [Clostridium folliculivorans]
MEDFNAQNNTYPIEIKLSIHDTDNIHYGGSQYWFPKKSHQLSGCGPVAAANITAYLSKLVPDKFSTLYPYKDNINKQDFIEHMIEIRKFVVPGMFGLTSVTQFSDNILAFCESRGVSLVPHILDEQANMQEAMDFILEALHLKLPVAILVLKHPVKELEDYTWHWMTITNLRFQPNNNKYYISVSTYGEFHEIDLDLLWNNRRPKDIIRLAYFT